PAGLCLGELRRHRPVARSRQRRPYRCCRKTADRRGVQGPRSAAKTAGLSQGGIRPLSDGKAADVRAGTGPRVLRPVHRRRDRQKGQTVRLPLFCAGARNCPLRSILEERDTAMIKPLSRRTVLRGLGTALALPWLEAMLPRESAGAAGGSKSGSPPLR